MAISLDPGTVDAFLARAANEFYVPDAAARSAIQNRGSFNLIDTDIPFKVDVFVLGDTLLDRRQIKRRVWVPLSKQGSGLWVTSPEDQVLRKLDWYRAGDGVSDQQWRDILGLLRVSREELDLDDLRSTATALGLGVLLDEAMRDSSGTG